MALKLYNSLTKSKELFTPLDEFEVKLYVCGPTVYDRAHIGNARAMVVFDVLYRILVHRYGKENVVYVRNITDIDDKINARAKLRNINISELTAETVKMFHQDMEAINCIALNDKTNPNLIEPHATDHIDDIINMIKQLIDNNHAYIADQHVLFDVNSYGNYGGLSGRTIDEMIAGARIEVADYKRNPGDFVLWKPSNSQEPGWDSPWGYGRPGWHIECSAMSCKYLGADFDIHGGGADLQFPHHENEIAQSVCTYPGSSFAKYWVHNGFLTVNGEKMSKSLNNFITVKDLLDKNIKGEVIRYILLATHYRKPLDWSEKSIYDAVKALKEFYNILFTSKINNISQTTEINQEFTNSLYDDINTPKAIATLHLLAKNFKKADNNEKNAIASELKEAANLIGLLQDDPKIWQETKAEITITDKIQELILKRNEARNNKDWALSDLIRTQIFDLGYKIIDNKDGETLIEKIADEKNISI